MNNIKSFYISSYTSSGIVCASKEEFLQYLSEEIDRIEESGEYKNFDVMINANNG